MKVFLQFGSRDNLPMITKEVEWKYSPMWFHEKNRQQTASGYGLKLVNPYMVKHPHTGKWRRVYTCLVSNSGTDYIGKPGNWEATVTFSEA